VPPDAHQLSDVLRRDYELFSPAQQALARYLVDHLAELPLLSAHEVAIAAHCSPATVVRFAQALGYRGYPELQRTVRQAQRPALPPRRSGQLGLLGGEDGIGGLLAADRLALEDAAARLGPQGLGPLAAALASRSPLVLAGEGHARPVVGILEERLARHGREVVVFDGLDARKRVRLSALGRGGAVLAVALGRETRVAEAAVAAARATGAPCAALVDSSLSALARLPLARVVPADERGGEPSLVAVVAVAQALAAALGAQAPARTVAAGAA
jgi:DNA-binding MurR/RpiR family transcriptional regulator